MSSPSSRISRQNAALLNDEEPIENRITNGINTYQIGSLIGKGAFGSVFSALSVGNASFVAVKRLALKAINSKALTEIEGEIELMQRLNHPNIVKYIDTIRSESYLYIVLEFMENGSLASVIKRNPAIFIESVTVIYIMQVLKGLKYLHEQGVMHRDIKCANILTSKDGKVKLADFGLAVRQSDVVGDQEEVVGSPYWMAPEIIEASPPTLACDIWSVGCVVIELLTGKPPYFDLPQLSAMFRIVSDDYPPLPEGISQALREFLLLCFQKEPAMRSSAANLMMHPWLYNSSIADQQGHLLSSTSNSGDETVDHTIRLHQKDNIVNNFDEIRGSHENEDRITIDNAQSHDSRDSLKSKGNSNSVQRTPSRQSGQHSGSGNIVTRSKSKDVAEKPSGKMPPRKILNSRSEYSPNNQLEFGRIERHISPEYHSTNLLVLKPKADLNFSSLSTANTVEHIQQTSHQSQLHTGHSRGNSTELTSISRMDTQEALHHHDSIGWNNNSSPTISNSPTLSDAPTQVFGDSSIQSKGDLVDGIADMDIRHVSSSHSMQNSAVFFQDMNMQRLGKSRDSQENRSHDNSSFGDDQSFSPPTRPDSNTGDEENEGDDEDWDAQIIDNAMSISIDSHEAPSKPFEPVTPPRRNSQTHPSGIPRSSSLISESQSPAKISDALTPKKTSIVGNIGILKAFSQSIDSPQRILPNSSSSTIPTLSNASKQVSYHMDTLKGAGGRKASVRSMHSVETAESNYGTNSFDNFGDKEPFRSPFTLSAKSSFLLTKFQERPEESGNFDDLLDDEESGFQFELEESNDFFPSNLKGSNPTDQFFNLQTRNSRNLTSRSSTVKSLSTIEDVNEKESEDGEDDEDDYDKDFVEESSSDKYSRAVGHTFSSGLFATRTNDAEEMRYAQKIKSKRNISNKLASYYSAPDQTYDDLGSEGGNEQVDLASRLRERMRRTSTEVIEQEDDEFINYQFEPTDFRQDENKDVHFRRSREVVEIMSKIRPDSKEEDVKDLCSQLIKIFSKYPEQRDHLVTYHGVMPIIDMFEARLLLENRIVGSSVSTTNNHPNIKIKPYVLKVINKIVEGSIRVQEQLSLVGLIPTIMNLFERSCQASRGARLKTSSLSNQSPSQIEAMEKLGHRTFSFINAHNIATPINISASIANSINLTNDYSHIYEVDPLTLEAARFIHQISSTSSLTLQMLIGAGGLTILTNMISFGAFILRTGSSPLSDRISPPADRIAKTVSKSKHFQVKLESIVGSSSSSENLSATSWNNTENTITLDNVRKSYIEDGGTAIDVVYDNKSLDIETSDDTADMDEFENKSPHKSPIPPPLHIPADSDANNSMLIFQMGVDCMTQVFAVQSARTRDFCRLFVKLGMLPHLSLAFHNILSLYLGLIHSGRNTEGGSANGDELKTVSSMGSAPFSHRKSEPLSSQLRHHASANDLSLLRHAHSVNSGFNSVHRRVESLGSTGSYGRTVTMSDAGGYHTSDDSKERKYTKEIATLLLKFSRSDAIVAETMARNDYGVITVILQALKAPELRRSTFDNSFAYNITSLNSQVGSKPSSPFDKRRNSIPMPAQTSPLLPAYVEIIELLLKCLKNLSMEPSTLDDLEHAGTMEVLIPLLDGPISERCIYHILPCVFNMCRVSRRRQEQAAMNGIIPHLKRVISSGSILKSFAFPIIFDLAHASAKSRIELWKNEGVVFYVEQLKENYWQTFALNSLTTWLLADTVNVSNMLIEQGQLSKLIDFFCKSSQQVQHVRSMTEMMAKSKEMSAALGCSSVFVSSIVELLRSTNDAMILRFLLKMLHVINKYHSSPRQFVLDNDLYNLVKEFTQSSAKVLVSELANRLLQEFENSTKSF